jgi:hypothetical protein
MTLKMLMPRVIMLSVTIMSIKLNAIMLSVIMLNVMAPILDIIIFELFCSDCSFSFYVCLLLLRCLLIVDLQAILTSLPA